MPSLVELTVDAAVEQILVKAKELMVAATAVDEPLEGFSVVRGDRARPNPGFDSIWIVPDEATIDVTTQGLAELWNFQIILGAIIKNDDPDLGFMEANKAVGKAQQVLLGRNRRWDLAFVDHVKPVRFDPSSPRTSNAKRSLFWADAVIMVTFRRLEPGG